MTCCQVLVSLFFFLFCLTTVPLSIRCLFYRVGVRSEWFLPKPGCQGDRLLKRILEQLLLSSTRATAWKKYQQQQGFVSVVCTVQHLIQGYYNWFVEWRSSVHCDRQWWRGSVLQPGQWCTAAPLHCHHFQASHHPSWCGSASPSMEWGRVPCVTKRWEKEQE